MPIKFGPAGLGGVSEAIKNLEEYHKLGLKACEIAFTYGAYIKTKPEAEEIARAAEKYGISLSIHAPYWINLNSHEKKKVEQSKQRILKSLEVGTWLGAKKVVFHPGFYGNISKEETYNNIKKEIIELQKTRKEKKYVPELAPETTGKINVYGSVDEIAQLVKDTGCSFCIDFAHILAREKNYLFGKTLAKLGKGKEIHIHFSGIDYGEKGEKNHKKTGKEEWKKLLEALPKEKEITIINEAPTPMKDSVEGLRIYENLK
ncbi:TIM barrel protein [Candidatus Pacearchaeota archaeon]|nr:TIM barrel protein [Candidatus Pacearchaeota archaeon]